MWSDYDLAGLLATDESMARHMPEGVLISSTRSRWGYAAVADLSGCGAIEEIAVGVDVLGGDLSVSLASDDDSELLYEQSLPTGWQGSVHLPSALAVGRTHLTLRSNSEANAPLVALIRSVRLLRPG